MLMIYLCRKPWCKKLNVLWEQIRSKRGVQQQSLGAMLFIARGQTEDRNHIQSHIKITKAL